jgi:hypothetical protein
MEKQIVVSCSIKKLSFQTEEGMQYCYYSKVDEVPKPDTESKKPDTKGHIRTYKGPIIGLHLFEILRIDKSIEMECKLGVSRSCRERRMKRNWSVVAGFYFGMSEMFWN